MGGVNIPRGRFSISSLNDRLIDTTLLGDRDFIAWRAEQPAEPATSADTDVLADDMSEEADNACG